MAEKSRSTDLTRDQRRDVQLLCSIGWTQAQIATKLSFTRNQVRYALSHPPEPIKRSGRPPILTAQQVEDLIEFITANKENRRIPFNKLASCLGWENIGEYAIRHTLRRHGFSRCVATARPPCSERTRQLRLEWAQRHVNWSFEQWSNIIWSDETWVTPGRHRKTYVTRRSFEAFDQTCIIDKVQRKKGWMFWACFAGNEKGPCLFWEKEWGTINAETYQQHIIPLVDGWIRLKGLENLVFMQDNAPAHAAKPTIQELEERGIKIMVWPPFSPDLNPIEHVWRKMKDWKDEQYPKDDISYDLLRKSIREAWVAISIEFLEELVATMHERCLSVIAANGGPTFW